MDTSALIDTKCPYCKQTYTKEVPRMEPDPEYYCKHPTDSGPCRREVDAPFARCWQHTEDESDE
jgi:hypothetical protein